jgi:hypothetical protein
MTPLNAATGLTALTDVDVELPVDGLARDLDLVLLGDVSLVKRAAAIGADRGQWRLVDLVDLLGGRRLAVGLGAVILADPGCLHHPRLYTGVKRRQPPEEAAPLRLPIRPRLLFAAVRGDDLAVQHRLNVFRGGASPIEHVHLKYQLDLCLLEKQPYGFHLWDDKPFAFAGLWDVWKDPAGRPQPTFCILTTAANELVRPVHGRMPVIVPGRHLDLWLAHDVQERAESAPVLRPTPRTPCAPSRSGRWSTI